MKLLIVGTYPGDHQYSLMGFARALLKGCQEAGIETRLIVPRTILGKPGKTGSGLGKWLGHIDKLLFFPIALRHQLGWPDVIHFVDHGLAVYVKHVRGVPHIVTCNDLIAMRASLGELPEWRIGGTAVVLQKSIRQGLKKAQHVVCISEATRQDLCRLTGLAENKTTLIYDSLFHPFAPMPESEQRPILNSLGLANTAFLFHIGRNAPTKNRIGAVKIFAAVRHRQQFKDLHMVMAGKALSAEIRSFIKNEGLEDVVHELVGISDEQVCALYSGAKCLIFPSFYEGFGMPIIEAQACGCPVFTTNRAPMTEVGGEAAIYFDPANIEEAAQVVVQGLENNTMMMSERGFENIKRFKTERMIREYIEVYNRVSDNTQGATAT